MNRNTTVKGRLHTLLFVCLVPLAVMTVSLLLMVNRFSRRYDVVVEKISIANAYNINFKDDLDYLMYIIVANSERAGQLVDTEQPRLLIAEAREGFGNLYESADAEYAKNRLSGILKSLDTLEERVNEIEADAQVIGNYDKNMESLELNIRVITELIQEQIQKYIYYETTNLEVIRRGIRSDVVRVIQLGSLIFAAILIGAVLVSRRISRGITDPIARLCEVTEQAGKGDFTARIEEEGGKDELEVLGVSFNRMVEQLGHLVEDIKVEQKNLRAMELKLLQAQINPHFLYNTLDTIIWLAEAGEKEKVVMMVTSLSDFFRTTLSKGREFITVREEEAHICSYLKIQQIRYQDILEYEIEIPKELEKYEILKLTLQPLVENALYHGIKNKRGRGYLRVSAEQQGEKLIFCVQDNGKGIGGEELAHVRKIISGEAQAQGDSSGFGLFNVQQRIQLKYGMEYGVEIESEAEKGTQVRVSIPAVKKTT